MDEIELDDTTALVITKNDCANCDETKDLFNELEAKYIVINMDEQPEWRDRIKSMGYRQAPVVITNDAKWSGFNEDAIRDFASGEDIW